MGILLSIGEMAVRLGVAVGTLRRWDREKRLCPKFRTVGGHRRYEPQDDVQGGKTVCYARVSCADQKDDLERQKSRLLDYVRTGHNPNVELIADLGSGMNYRKPGIKRLLTMILSGEVSKLVVENKDRLLRFGAELVFTICRLRGVEVIVIEASAKANFEVDLAKDVLEVITVFSSRLYGARAHRNKNLPQAC
jgi:predicted site-specific integrase-resolvase